MISTSLHVPRSRSGVAVVKSASGARNQGAAIIPNSRAARVYAARSSCRRAALKALGDTAFKIEPVEGGFVFLPIETADDALPPARFPRASDSLVDDHPPGLKRLRAAKGAKAIREATVADQKAGRAEAAARIAAQAEPLDLPTFLKPHDAASPALQAASAPGAADAAPASPEPATPRPARAKRSAPKEGTKARIIFDMLCRPEGATAKEIAAAGVPGVSVKVYAADFARAYGLAPSCEKDGPADRCRLVAKEATERDVAA